MEEKEEVFIGIGVNPDLCNKHYGQRMLLITYEISKKLYPDKPLYLEVRTWNIRAVKCYQKAGFRIDGQAYEIDNRNWYRNILSNDKRIGNST